MSKWKMVPVELTPEMWENMHERASYGPHKIHKAMLAAAPEWGPSEDDLDRARKAFNACHSYEDAMRAAILAAVGGDSE